MSKKISIDLADLSSIDKAIEMLDAYKNTLEEKRNELLKELGELGIKILSSNFQKVNADGDFDVSVNLINNNDGNVTIYVGGKSVLFIEFGTGIRYSESPEAKGDLVDASDIVERGQWGHKQGSNPKGWWYSTSDKKSHHTYGMPAQIPVYGSKQELIKRIDEVCRKVFREW